MNEARHIFHLTDEFSPQSGVTGMIKQLAGYLAGQGWATTILAGEEGADRVPRQVNFKNFPLAAGGIWRYPKGLRSYLESLAPAPGKVFHLHGVWMGFQWLAGRVALRQGTPALLSPHGMLNSWHLQNLGFNSLKKLAYWWTVAHPAFRHIPKIHAVTPLERDELAGYFPGQAIEVIPNAIDLGEMDGLLSRLGDEAVPGVEEPYLLFLGRLHPVKGLDLLIRAFAAGLPGAAGKFRLVIAGPEEVCSYAGSLKSLVKELGIEEKVSFLGPVYGSRKLSLYQKAWAFCAPSRSEVIGLVNLEAAAVKLPVVTTYGTGLCGWEEAGGILVQPRVEELSRALEQVFSWSESERQERGEKLRQLVERRYSWQVVGPQWLELYASLI